MKEFNKKNYVIIKSAISEETADVAKNYFALKAQILDTYQKNKYISPFNKDHMFIRHPSTGQLEQKTEAFGKPTFGFRSIIGINWTDDIEQVLFVMEYVRYLDKHWKDIEDLVTPMVENIAVKVRKIHKQFWNQFRVELQDVVDDANEAAPDRPLVLEENKRKIKVLIKK